MNDSSLTGAFFTRCFCFSSLQVCYSWRFDICLERVVFEVSPSAFYTTAVLLSGKRGLYMRPQAAAL